MRDTSNITTMEDILENTNAILKDLGAIMDRIEANGPEFKKLLDYYYSDERHEDIEDDHEGKLPADLVRGVLDEDSIWNTMEEYHQKSMDIIELGLKMMKINY